MLNGGFDEGAQKMKCSLLKGRNITAHEVSEVSNKNDNNNNNNTNADNTMVEKGDAGAPLEFSDEIEEDLSSDFETDEEELQNIFNEAKAEFPTEREVKSAEILPVAVLKGNGVYFVMKEVKSEHRYENDDGVVEQKESLIVRLIPTTTPESDEAIKVRLTGD